MSSADEAQTTGGTDRDRVAAGAASPGVAATRAYRDLVPVGAESSKPWWRFGRRARVALPIAVVVGGGYGALVAAALGIVLLITASSNFQNTYSLLSEKAELIMRGLSDDLTAKLLPVRTGIEDVSAIYAEDGFSLDDTTEVRSIFRGLLAGTPALSAMVLFKGEVPTLRVYRDAQGKFPAEIEKNEAPLERIPDFSRYPAGEASAWGPIRMYEHNIYVSVLAPLTRNGRTDGYVVAAVAAKSLNRIVEEIADEDGATVFLMLGETGGVFAHSDAARNGLNAAMQAADGPAPLSAIDDPVLRRLAPGPNQVQFRPLGKTGLKIADVDTPGDDYIVVTSVVPRIGEKPWIAGIYIPAREVSQEASRLINSIIGGVVATLLAVGLAIFLGRRIARSLRALSVSADHIARFEIDVAQPVPPSRIAELNASGRAFNGMLHAVQAFSRYVPRQLVRRMMERGFAEATRARRYDAAILFTDLVGFTTMSEHMQPEEVSHVLNQHFSELVACVEAEGGMVDKFLGDGLMAVWIDNERCPVSKAALCAALAMAEALKAGNRRAESDCRPPLRLRIGVHAGEVIVGNLGAAERMNYTTIGDPVNVASRLESLGKVVDCEAEVVILVSDVVAAAAPEIVCEEIGAVELRGRAGPIGVCRVPVP